MIDSDNKNLQLASKYNIKSIHNFSPISMKLGRKDQTRSRKKWPSFKTVDEKLWILFNDLFLPQLQIFIISLYVYCTCAICNTVNFHCQNTVAYYIEMRAPKTTTYYISPIEIGLLWAKITYLKIHSKALGFSLQTDMK